MPDDNPKPEEQPEDASSAAPRDEDVEAKIDAMFEKTARSDNPEPKKEDEPPRQIPSLPKRIDPILPPEPKKEDEPPRKIPSLPKHVDPVLPSARATEDRKPPTGKNTLAFGAIKEDEFGRSHTMPGVPTFSPVDKGRPVASGQSDEMLQELKAIRRVVEEIARKMDLKESEAPKPVVKEVEKEENAAASGIGALERFGEELDIANEATADLLEEIVRRLDHHGHRLQSLHGTFERMRY